jgi:predicted DNA-binding protein (UPF0251 family)
MKKDTVTMSLTDAARKLGVSRTAVTNAAKQGRFRPVLGGIDGTRIVGVYAADVDAMAERKTRNLEKNGGAK